VWDFWNTIKRPNLWIMDIKEEETQTKGIEKHIQQDNSKILPQP
jgi:hypothetical protein